MSDNPCTPLCLEVERRGDDVVVRPRGRLSEAESQQLTDELVARIEQGARRLVVHLREVPFITSSGLGSLMCAHKTGRGAGVEVVLAEMQPLVREVVATTKLNKLFPVFETLDEALGRGEG